MEVISCFKKFIATTFLISFKYSDNSNGIRYALTNYHSNLPRTKPWDNQLITERDI